MDEIDEDGFYINEIESLGTFKISKKDFYTYFDNVVASESWLQGVYSYKNFPSWAEEYLNSNSNIIQPLIISHSSQVSQKQETIDYVGNEIRNKIREIGKIWYNSPTKIKLSENSINHRYNTYKAPVSQ